ncbi:MAG: DUF4013 domain-containing protein [Thermomicrobiales bacterium]
MDIGRAFNFPFRDSGWISKVLIGAVMVLIPIFGWFSLAGYGMRIMRRVVEGADTPLPDWTDFGQLFVDGVKVFVVGVVWGIPAIIIGAIAGASDSFGLQCLSWFVSIATSAFTGAAIVPVALSGNIADGLQFQQVIRRVTSNISDYALIFVMGFVLSIVAVAGVIACIVGVLATIAYVSFVSSHLWAQAYRRSTGGGGLAPAPRF